ERHPRTHAGRIGPDVRATRRSQCQVRLPRPAGRAQIRDRSLPLRFPNVTKSIALTAALSLAFIQAACSRTEASAPRPDAEATLPIVPVARIARGAIARTTVLTAEFQPFQDVDVMAKVAGYVRTIHVDLGDRVREGQ